MGLFQFIFHYILARLARWAKLNMLKYYMKVSRIFPFLANLTHIGPHWDIPERTIWFGPSTSNSAADLSVSWVWSKTENTIIYCLCFTRRELVYWARHELKADSSLWGSKSHFNGLRHCFLVDYVVCFCLSSFFSIFLNSHSSYGLFNQNV